ncbi:MAG: hypothetical protein ACI399_07025 [Candidatus Cryptobacteroides sp.]
MLYRYKVTLAGIKGFFRVYEMGGETSLYDFHKQMRADMDFPQDQLIMFKGLDSSGGVVGRYGLFDLGSGTVDNVSVGATVGAGIVSFQYFYDVPNRKSVIVTLDSVEEELPGGSPVLVDVKGPNPVEFENGYVAYEDLPDSQRHLPGQKPDWSMMGLSEDSVSDLDLDGDDGEDEEDDDDEDGKIVFDGTEDLDI